MARRNPNYGRILPTHRWQGLTWRQRLARGLRAWRPWAGLVLVLAAIWRINRLWEVEPPRPRGTPFAVSQTFHRCGKGRGPNCVVDGDTLVMGARRIRITGIDAPEIGQHARCPREAEMAEAAAAHLLRLVQQGPFIMQPPSDGLRDDYGRELMHITRKRADGSVQDFAEDLLASGTVRSYHFGARQPWC